MYFEGDSSGTYLKSVVYPTLNGNYLDFIPFYVIDDRGMAWEEYHMSMINDLADLNLGHYLNSADWENELHWVGAKTPIFPGFPEGEDVVIGKPLITPEECTPFFLEAQSDSGLNEEMQNKESRMAVLGAERIAQQGKYIASAQTSHINSISETSMISNMSKAVSEIASQIFTFMFKWNRDDIKVRCTLNTDYYQDDISGEELVKWVEALQTGAISYDAYYFNLEKKEAFPPGWSKEKERRSMEDTAHDMNTPDEEEVEQKAIDLEKKEVMEDDSE